MSDDCARCTLLTVAVQDAEAGAHEERLAKDAALRQAVAERKRADRIEAELHQQHEAAQDAKVIRACLAVWEEQCWAGTRKPSAGLSGKRAALVRKALGYERIGPEDICDAFRGLGLLPYEGPYGKRSPTKKPGFERKAGVDVAVRVTPKEGLDEGRLERFRDYYRRVQATPADRLREQWDQATAVAGLLFVELLRARTLEEREQERQQASQRGHLFVVPDPESEVAA